MPMLKMMARNPSSSPNVSGVQLKNLDLLVSFPSALSFEIFSVAYLHIQSMDCVATTARTHIHTHTHTHGVCAACMRCMCVWCVWVHVWYMHPHAHTRHTHQTHTPHTHTTRTHHTHTPHTPHAHTAHTHTIHTRTTHTRTTCTHHKHTCNPNRASISLRSKECNMTRHCTCVLDFGSGKYTLVELYT